MINWSSRRWIQPSRTAARAYGVFCIMLSLLATPLACTTTIIPPANPADPVPVFLLDHGRTPSIVLTISDDRMVRYAYGEWKWYALGQTGLFRGMAALFLPTQGTLGRQEITGPATVEHLHSGVTSGSENIYVFDVPRDRVLRLNAKLDEIHYRNIATAVKSLWGDDMIFVKHPQKYTYFSNSNHMAARWLRELGCTIRGPAFSSRWRVRAP